MRPSAPARIALLALAFAAPAAAGAEVVALLPVTGVNVDPGTLEAAREVFRGHLERTGREVRLVPGDPAREPSPAEAAEAARAAGASRAAVVRIVTLGAVQRARLSIYDAASGRVLHTDDMPAGSPNDLDPVLERLAKGYAAGSGAARVAEIDTVTDREARPLNRVTANKSSGLRLGGITPLTPGGQSTGTGGGYFWLYDARSFLVDVSFDLYFGSHYHDVALGFGAYYPLTKENFTPYVGAGLKYAWTRFGGDNSSGLQPYGAVGLLLGRLSTVGVRGEVAWFYDWFKTSGDQAQGLLWSIGVYF